MARMVCEASRVRMTRVALVVVTASLLAVPTGANASSPAHPARPAHQTKCKNDGHKYIEGKTATAHGKKVDFVGTFLRFHPCGEDDGYFTGHKTITLTLTSKTSITMFKNELNPSVIKTVKAAHFPHAYKKNKDEPFYRYSGPRSVVRTLLEHFVS
jgi:hypothetical protein